MADDELDPLLAGRGGLGYDRLDEVARRLHRELTEIAVDQISRPIAHEFDIRIDIDRTTPLSPPDGFRRPAAGSITTLVEARSRSVRPVVTQLRVTVWPALGGADVADLQIVREGTEHRLDVDVDEAHPDVSEGLRHRMNDFVAGIVASAVAQLNAAMQRQIGQRTYGWEGPDVPESGD